MGMLLDFTGQSIREEKAMQREVLRSTECLSALCFQLSVDQLMYIRKLLKARGRNNQKNWNNTEGHIRPGIIHAPYSQCGTPHNLHVI